VAEEAEEAEPSGVRRSLFGRSAGGQRATVVVSSNTAEVTEVLARLVETAGHRAVRASAPGEVAEIALREEADAVLLDADAANLELVRALRNAGGPLSQRVRIVSVELGPASARLAWNAGVDAVLTRPFPATEVPASLAAVLARSDDERAAERQRQAGVPAG